MNEAKGMRRGELYRVRKPKADRRQSRVFVVVSRDALLRSTFSTLMCAPVYTHGEGLTTQVPLGVAEGLRHDSWIMCDNLTSLRRSELTDFVSHLSPAKIDELDGALRSALHLR